ncbi:MAG: preprotein translocase subunit SecY [Mollicutes bacterium PWAP]|nr:preprotein translocase subunit SecY [Mollicutes bacterium PWAP]
MSKSKQSFANFSNKVKGWFQNRPLLKKILYTLLLILIFRIAATITIPGVKVDPKFGQDTSSLVGIFDLMGGGSLRSFSIVALGISPFITASIIMQFLQTEAFPPIYRLSTSGPAGKRKINIISRCLTLIFAIINSIVIIQTFKNGTGYLKIINNLDHWWFIYIVIPIILVSGSLFTLFLGEQITEKGVGNGTTLIIFSGIAATLPTKFQNAFIELAQGHGSVNFSGVMEFALYILVFLTLLFIIGYIYKSERKVPIQKTGGAMTKKGEETASLPIKVNPASIMPVIFSVLVSSLPLTIVQFMDHQNLGRIWVENHLKLTQPIGLAILIGLIFLLTPIMGLLLFNPDKVSEDFKNSSTFIPGVRPGNETNQYLNAIIIRLSIFSAIYLSVIASTSYVEQIIGLSPQITFGGTSLIILVTATVETFSQIKARKKTQNISKLKKKATSNKDSKGLLW